MPNGCYNIVLLPDEQTTVLATKLAEDNFSLISNGYCLKEGSVFPHITLGQFQTEDPQKIRMLKKSVEDSSIKECPISFSNFYGRFDKRYEMRRIWIGLTAEKNSQLSSLQELVDGWLRREAIDIRNASLADYWPHMTFARIDGKTVFPSLVIPDYFWTDDVGKWRLAIGESDENGQFLGVNI